MLDRKVPRIFSGIDTRIVVLRVDYEGLSGDQLGESSASIRDRLQAVQERQRVRTIIVLAGCMPSGL